MEKLKEKNLSSSESVKTVRCVWWGPWREGLLEKVRFEFRVEMNRSDRRLVTVVMTGEMGLDDWDEKSEEKND